MSPALAAFTYNIRILKIVGSWYSNNRLQQLYNNALLIATFLVYISTVTAMLLKLSNKEPMENYYNIIAELESPIKLLFFRKNARQITGVLELFGSGAFRAKSPHQERIQARAKTLSTSLQIAYYVLCFVLLLFMFSPSLFGDDYRMFILIWLPFGYESPYRFGLVFAYVAISCLICAYINVALDLFLYISCIEIAAQFECLCDTLRNLDTVTQTRALIQCIRHYNTITKSVALLHEGYKEIITVQVALSTVSICITLYQMTTETNAAMLASLALFQTTMTVEIFGYCYFCQKVTNQSSNVLYASFESEWYLSSSKFQKTLGIFMEEVRKPVVLYAWNILPINLETFKGIIQKSWAFFIALKNIQEVK